MKKITVGLLGMAALLLTTGCHYLNSKMPENPPTGREQLCADLKRNLVFNSSTTTLIGNTSATQRATLMRLYDKNNCSEFEGK